MPKKSWPKLFLFILFLIFISFIFFSFSSLKSAKNKNDKPPIKKDISQKIFFPIKNYSKRLKIRRFGQLIKPEDSEFLICGHSFNGYHTGDDLEISGSELDQEIPVFSIADGKVLQVVEVPGYGGLLIIRYQLTKETVTVYYGHINLETVKVKENSQVFAGQKLAHLGDHCSEQTGLERKHLHFAIYKGKDINFRGYITDKNQLKNWLNPYQELKKLQAIY